MARIKLYESRSKAATARAGTGLLGANFQAKDFGGGQGVRDIGSALVKVQEKQDQKTRVDIRNELAKENLDITKTVAAMEASAELGAPGHTDNVDAVLGQRLSGLQSKYDKRFHGEIAADFASIQARQVGSAIRFSATAGAEKFKSDIRSIKDTAIETATVAPEQVPNILEDLQKSLTEAGIAASSEYFRVGDSVVEDELRVTAGNAYAAATGTLIEAATDDATVDKIVSRISDEDSPERAYMDSDQFTKLLDFAESRKDQIFQEDRRQRQEMAIQSNVQLQTEMVATMISAQAGDAKARHRITSGEFVRQAVRIAKVTGSRDLLGTAASLQISMIKEDQKNLVLYADTEYDFQVIDDVGAASKGKLSIAEINQKWEERFYKPADYDRAKRAREAYDRKQEAVARGDLADARKWSNELNDTINKLKADQEKIEAKDLIYRLSKGAVKDPEAAIESLPPALQVSGKKARDSWMKKSVKEQEAAQTEIMNLEYAKAVNRILEDGDRLSAEALEQIPQTYKERFGHLSRGLNKVNQLIKMVSPEVVESRRTAVMSGKVALALADNKSPLPRDMDTKSMGALDRAVSAHMAHLEQTLQDKDPSVRHDAVIDARGALVKNLNVVPDIFVNQIRSGIASQDPSMVAKSAMEMQRFIAINPTNAEYFKGEKFSLGNDISNYMAAGIGPEKAYNLAVEDRDLFAKVTKETRLSSYRDSVKENPHADFLKGKIDSDPNWDETILGQAEQSLEFKAAFEFLTEREYLRNGNISHAQDTAFKTMKGSWGISYMGGSPVFRRHPPELVYGLPSMSAEENANWIRNEVIEEAGFIKDADGNPKYDLEGREIIMQVHPRFTNKGRPTYQVFFKDDVGAIHHIPEFEGVVPDWNSSQEARTHQGLLKLEESREREAKRVRTLEELEERKRINKVRQREAKRGGGAVR